MSQNDITHNIWNFNNDTKGYIDISCPAIAWKSQYLLCDNGVERDLIDQATGEKVQEIRFSFNNIKTVLHPDGRFVADISSSSTIEIVKTSDSTIQKTLSFTTFSGDRYNQSVAIGTIVIDYRSMDAIATAYSNGNIGIWDAENGENILTLSSNSSLIGLAFSPDGQTLTSLGKDNDLRLWNLSDKSFIHLLSAPGGPLAFSPDGLQLAFYIGDEQATMNLLTSEIKNAGFSYLPSPYRDRFLFSPTGDLLNLGFAENIYSLINSSSNEVLLFLNDLQKSQWYNNDVSDIDTMAIRSDGSLFAYAKYNGMISVWDLPSQSLIKTFQGHPVISTMESIWSTSSMAFSPHSNLLLTVGADKTTRLWNALTGVELRRLNVCCYADFTPDGRYLVTAGDGVIRVWGIPEQ